jgi:hypothetical protein
MIKGLIPAILAAMLTRSALAINGCNASYLVVTLWDSFGDGWDDAWWYLSDPAGRLQQNQSTCTEVEKKIIVSPCDHPPSVGDYFMIVQTPDESLPQGWWEIYWKVEVFNSTGEPLGVVVEGVYNTTMIWNFDGFEWTLVLIENSPNFNCTGCSGGPCEAKPKPKPKKPEPKEKKGPIRGRGSETKSETSNSTDSDSDGSGGFKYGPRAVDLTIKMSSEECNGWDYVTPIGAHWYIADYTMTKLFDDGSLCDQPNEPVCEGVCNICLGDGTYIFRVTGPTFNETAADLGVPRYQSWEFCHAQGGYNDQLNFHVKKGKCIPDDLRYVDDICDELENTTVTLNGVIALGGISTELFSMREASVIISVLKSSVDGWSKAHFAILETSLDTRNLVSGTRALNSFTHDISFTVSFDAEDYDIDGTRFAVVQGLVNDMASSLQAAFSTGAFGGQLMLTAQAGMFSDTITGELISLDIASIHYSHNSLVYIYDNTDSGEVTIQPYPYSSNGKFSYGIIAVIATATVAIVAAFIGILHHKRNAYTQVSVVSDHGHQQISEDVEIEDVRNPFTNTEYPVGKRTVVFAAKRV